MNAAAYFFVAFNLAWIIANQSLLLLICAMVYNCDNIAAGYNSMKRWLYKVLEWPWLYRFYIKYFKKCAA
jgi:hypothetical protein